MTANRVVYLTGQHDFHYAITKPSATSGKFGPATGETVQGLFSAAEPTIGSSQLDVTDVDATTTSMAELSGTPGSYLGTLAHDDLVDGLGPSVGRTVYEVITVGGIVSCVTPVDVRLAKSA